MCKYNMTENKKIEGIDLPLNTLLMNISHSFYNKPCYFETGPLFWSLSRIFTSYYRINYPLLNNKHIDKNFIESDIESFIIRHRIILDDISYIIRQILPENHQKLKGPKGDTHPRNKNVSIYDLIKFVKKQPKDFSSLTTLINDNKDSLLNKRSQRDDIVHYKAKATIFGSFPNYEFAFINNAGTESTKTNYNGGKSIITEPVTDFINSDMKFLWNFMHSEVKKWIEVFLSSQGKHIKKIFTENAKMQGLGIELFKNFNNLT